MFPIGDRGCDFFHGVAVLTEMGQKDFLPPWLFHRIEQFFRRAIRQVTMSSDNTLFNRPRAFSIFVQHVRIMIGFKHQHIHMADAFSNQLGNIAQISRPGETPVWRKQVAIAILEYESDRIIRIVGNGETGHLEVTKLKGRPGLKQLPSRALFQFGLYGLGGLTIGIEFKVLELA